MILKGTTEILELSTSTTSPLDVSVTFSELDNLSASETDTQRTKITTITTTTILGAGSSTTKRRKVTEMFIKNIGTTANIVSVKTDISGTEYTMHSASIGSGETLTYGLEKGFELHSKAGYRTEMVATDKTAPINAFSTSFLKVGAANEAAGIWHSQHAATGTPGAWSPGTPGLNGRATDGTTVADNGCIKVKNAVTGTNYITSFEPNSTVASVQMLFDYLWINTGLVVTTTTAQAITPVSLPARDMYGTTNGDGVMMGLLVTTATTNAAVITNITASYTDSNGTAGKTATMSSFPATAVAGTLVTFQLASGNSGVRSVQSVTLGTSLGGGAVSLVLYRIVQDKPVLLANTGANSTRTNENVKLFPGVCLIPVVIPTTTTAQTITGFINIEEK